MPPEQPSVQAKGRVAAMRAAWRDLTGFVHKELWDLDLTALPRLKKLAFSAVRIVWIVGKGFVGDKCALQASALTYISLMSMVPVLAMMFWVAKGAGYDDKLMLDAGLVVMEEAHHALDENGEVDPETLYRIDPESTLATLPEQAQTLAKHLCAYVERTDFNALGTLGSLLLLWTVIRMMGKAERTFNLIWGIREHRSWRQFPDYVFLLVVVPFLILGVTGLNALLSSDRVCAFWATRLGALYWIYQKLIGLTGVLALFVAFSFLYAFMPNTRVRFVPAAVAGVVGGGAWFLVQIFYFNGQAWLTRKNAIYGTFAAFPVFLFWLYMSWVIVLFGAELCFAIQNYDTYVHEGASAHASFATRETLGFVVTYEVCRAFCRSEGPWSPVVFARKHVVPRRLMEDVLFVLSENGILLRVPQSESKDSLYVPGADPTSLSLADVHRAFRGRVAEDVVLTLDAVPARLGTMLTETARTLGDSLGSRTFREMVDEGTPA